MLNGNRFDWKRVVKRSKTMTHYKISTCVRAVSCMWKIWDHKSAGAPCFCANMLARWLYIYGFIIGHGFSSVTRLDFLTTPHNSMLTQHNFFIIHNGFIKLMTWPFFIFEKKKNTIPSIAAACYTIHYAKRLYETLFIHRFSHATMPLSNLFKNCAYYWGFTAYVAYHVCHPLYTAPSPLQTYIGLAGFAVNWNQIHSIEKEFPLSWWFLFELLPLQICELGNLSTHIALRNLRPSGTRVRKIPVPDSNPLTNLFKYVKL